MGSPDGQAKNGAMPRGVVALGLVSMCMDISSEMVHSLLPLFLVGVLGVGALSVGIIEGIAEATAAATKVFSGAISDWIGRRKPLLLLGYGMAALTKPLFPLATSASEVLVARFVDRIGKGIRGAPRDALIADLTPAALRGAAYGLRQSMDTVGAFVGPALALVLMALSGSDFRLVFWIAVLPSLLAVVVILLGVHETRPAPVSERRLPVHRAEIARLSTAYWRIVGFAAILTLARFSEAFLLLRADSVGMLAAHVPAVLIVMNIAYAASAYPFGLWSDRIDRRLLILFGIALLIAADLVLAWAGGVAAVLAGAVLWGVHMGATQSLLSAMVADEAPENLRGTAFGLFNLISGGALLLASVIAGGLWSALGPGVTFLAGAGFSAVALAGLWLAAAHMPPDRPAPLR